MARQSINGHDIEVVLIAADGKTDSQALLNRREAATVAAVDTTLRADAQFTTTYPSAQLVRVESNRGVNEHRQGRYYLRYQHTGGTAEFWGHVAKTASVDLKKGVVGVSLPSP